MFKKITTIISTSQDFGRKARIVGGVILGIGIGVLLHKSEDFDLIVVEEQSDEEENLPSYDDGEDKDVPAIDQ